MWSGSSYKNISQEILRNVFQSIFLHILPKDTVVARTFFFDVRTSIYYWIPSCKSIVFFSVWFLPFFSQSQGLRYVLPLWQKLVTDKNGQHKLLLYTVDRSLCNIILHKKNISRLDMPLGVVTIGLLCNSEKKS